jgi:hypothetical protein
MKERTFNAEIAGCQLSVSSQAHVGELLVSADFLAPGH